MIVYVHTYVYTSIVCTVCGNIMEVEILVDLVNYA